MGNGGLHWRRTLGVLEDVVQQGQERVDQLDEAEAGVFRRHLEFGDHSGALHPHPTSLAVHIVNAQGDDLAQAEPGPAFEQDHAHIRHARRVADGQLVDLLSGEWVGRLLFVVRFLGG